MAGPSSNDGEFRTSDHHLSADHYLVQALPGQNVDAGRSGRDPGPRGLGGGDIDEL
jgi:hypothetical protein